VASDVIAFRLVVECDNPDGAWWPGHDTTTNAQMLEHEVRKQLGRSGIEIKAITRIP
jgi:hypothetical protein